MLQCHLEIFGQEEAIEVRWQSWDKLVYFLATEVKEEQDKLLSFIFAQ